MGYRSLITIMGVIALAGCATTYRAGAPDGAIDVIAHRGASAYAPENTLASFAQAKELGADWFELDCTLTKDSAVIVIHDDDVERTTDRKRKDKVADLTLAELKTLDAGSWKDPKFAGERLPTLGEALDLAKQGRIGIYIEIKNAADDAALIGKIMKLTDGRDKLSPAMRREVMAMIRSSGSRNLELTRKVIQLIRQRRMTRRVLIQSFSPIVCAIALDEAPKIRMAMLAEKDDKKPERWPLWLRWRQLLEPPEFNPGLDSMDKPLLDKVHAEGQCMAVWTVDKEADMRRLAEWGVDGIITNKPDVCLRVLKEMGKH